MGQVLYAVGIGPGGEAYITEEAKAALAESEVIAGYGLYVDLIKERYPGKEWIVTGMRAERERCRLAIESALSGKVTAVVCSGDAGVYGMAGLLYEMSEEHPELEIRVVAGVTAALSGAAVLGSPIGHDFAVISLSDLMTPWELIETRLEMAARGDYCICLYNPASHGRKDYLEKACDILLQWKAPGTLCGYVRQIGRNGEEHGIMPLSGMRDYEADMLTTIFIGNSRTREINGHMVTPRGYEVQARREYGEL